MCDSPLLRFNPTSLRLLDLASYFVLNNKKIYFTPSTNYSFRKRLIALHADCYDSCTNFYKTDPEYIYNITHGCFLFVNGVRYPMFISLPCGKCLTCNRKRKSQYTNRLLLESNDCSSMFFFTLTYREDTLPTEGVCRSDVVLFMKRLRINIARFLKPLYNHGSDNVDLSFRSFYVAEYGTDTRYTQRAHYHGLLFFKSPVPIRLVSKLRSLVFRSWNKGRIDFQLCRNKTASARYLSKYIGKQLLYKPNNGKNPCFYQGPSKNGGLGMSQLEKYRNDILNSTDGTILIPASNGSTTRVAIPPCVYRRLFSTLSSDFGHINDIQYILETVSKQLFKRGEPEFVFLDPLIQVRKRIAYATRGLSKPFTKELFKTAAEHEFYLKVLDVLPLSSLYKLFDDAISVSMSFPTQNEYEFFYKEKNAYFCNRNFEQLTFEEYGRNNKIFNCRASLVCSFIDQLEARLC